MISQKQYLLILHFCLFDFVIYLFCTIFLILEQCARQPMGIIFFEMAKYLSLIMYVKIVNKFLKPK